MDLFIQILSSFISALAFGIIIKVPKDALIYCGITGMLAWGTNLLIQPFVPNSIAAIFIASIVVAIISIVFARKKRMPATVFNIPGVFPLVPGVIAFQGMNAFMKREFLEGIEFMTKTFSISITIALAIVITEVLYRFIMRVIAERALKLEQKN